MDQRDRAGEPKQLWSPNTETHSILSLLTPPPWHQMASQRAPPFQSRLNLPLTTNWRGNVRGEMCSYLHMMCWCVWVTIRSNSFSYSGRSQNFQTWKKGISRTLLASRLKKKLNLEGCEAKQFNWNLCKKQSVSKIKKKKRKNVSLQRIFFFETALIVRLWKGVYWHMQCHNIIMLFFYLCQ